MNEQKQTKWINSLERIQNEVFVLLENRKIFNTLIKQHNKQKFDNNLWNFIKFHYAGNMTMSVCRQVDNHKDAESLFNLLEDILENAHTISREWFLGKWPDGEEEELFKNLFVNSDHLVVKRVCSDISKLTVSAETLKNHRDKRIAHSDKKLAIPEEPEFDDIEKSIDVIKSLFNKYYYLLKQSSNRFSL